MKTMKILIVILIILCTAFTFYILGMFSISSSVQELTIDTAESSATVFITEYTNSNAGYEVYVSSINDWDMIHCFTYDGIEFINPKGKVLLTDSIYRTPAIGITKEFTIYTTETGMDYITFMITGK